MYVFTGIIEKGKDSHWRFLIFLTSLRSGRPRRKSVMVSAAASSPARYRNKIRPGVVQNMAARGADSSTQADKFKTTYCFGSGSASLNQHH